MMVWGHLRVREERTWGQQTNEAVLIGEWVLREVSPSFQREN